MQRVAVLSLEIAAGEVAPRTPQAGPPQPAALVFGSRAPLLGGFAAQEAAALVLALPIVGAVFFPVLTELGGEGFREQEELDVVAARGEVFFDEAADGGGSGVGGRRGEGAGFLVAGMAGAVVVRVLVSAAVLAGGVFDEVPLASAAL